MRIFNAFWFLKADIVIWFRNGLLIVLFVLAPNLVSAQITRDALNSIKDRNIDLSEPVPLIEPVASIKPVVLNETGSSIEPENLGEPDSFSDLLAGAGSGVSSSDLKEILEVAAENGQPQALWQLGQMYENGVGVEQDSVRAFGYFSKIANENASVPPHSLQADIVARSFVKVGDYYRVGLPGAGIAPDQVQARALLFHAASYFGNANAQYKVGLLYLEEELGPNPLLSARWLSLAAQKNQVEAQAILGDLLFNGTGVEAKPVE
ncbi:hypothetical protein MNBD_ALPHA11-2397, partial [hydrothermal vent metagenome]